MQCWVVLLTSQHCFVQILAELHEERSHRDLKPQNIVVTQSTARLGIKAKVTVKLIDFAASRKQSEGAHHSTFASCYVTSLTSTLADCARVKCFDLKPQAVT